MNKLISLILPAYQKVAHAGQTPVPYQQKNLFKFENILVDRSQEVWKEDNIIQLQRHDAHGNARLTVRRYVVKLDMTTPALAEIVASALDLFALDRVHIIIGSEVQDWGRDEVEAFGTGVHEWCESKED